MSYFAPYIDGTGIHMPTYDDRLQALVSSYQSIFGLDTALDPNVPDYQLLSVFAKALDDTAALVLQAFNSRNPAYATGQALDLLLPQYGLTRRSGETDAAARARIAHALASRGTSIPDAIVEALYNVPDVTHVMLRVNDTDATVDSIPAHCIAAIVDGGNAGAVAKTIYEKKTPGISTYGSVTRTVTDEHGVGHTIKFSRPTYQSIFFYISIKSYTGFVAADVEAAMNELLMNYVNNVMDIGESLIIPQLYGKLYQAASSYASTFAITDLYVIWNGGTVRDKLTAAWNTKWNLHTPADSIFYTVTVSS